MAESFEVWLAARPGLAELRAVVVADPDMHERMPGFLYQMAARLKSGRPLSAAQESACAGAWSEWKAGRRRALGPDWTPLPAG